MMTNVLNLGGNVITETRENRFGVQGLRWSAFRVVQ